MEKTKCIYKRGNDKIATKAYVVDFFQRETESYPDALILNLDGTLTIASITDVKIEEWEVTGDDEKMMWESGKTKIKVQRIY